MEQTIQIFIYGIIAAILVWAAYSDLQSRRIPNTASVIIFCLFILLAATNIIGGVDFMAALTWPAVTGGAALIIGLILFSLNAFGGGDVKLIAAMAFITGPGLILPFILYIALAGGIVALATLAHAKFFAPQAPEPLKVPYGVAIMASGLWVCSTLISQINSN